MVPALHPSNPTLPDEKALGAMAKAVQRAQGSAEPDGHGETNPEIQAAYLAATRALSRRRRERVLKVLSVVVAVLVVMGATTLVTVVVARHIHSSSTPSASGTRSSSAPSTTTATTLPPVVPGGAPVLMSLQPSSGSAGQVITVQGANFISSDGRITASFGTESAPTECPSSTKCSVTVPPAPPGSTSTPVTITTASGTSNSQDFTYQ